SRNVISSLGVRVKLSMTPLDEAGWAARAAAVELSGALSDLNARSSARYLMGEFQPVEARFVRLEISGHNGADKGEPGQGHADLALGRVQLFGPNRIPVTPVFSAAQPAGADGVVTSLQGGRTAALGTLNDDSEPAAPGFGAETSIL